MEMKTVRSAERGPRRIDFELLAPDHVDAIERKTETTTADQMTSSNTARWSGANEVDQISAME